MSRFRGILSPLLISAATAAAAYGGYGAGVVEAAGAGWLHWLQVAGLMLTALALGGAGLWAARRQGHGNAVSFAAEMAALERLVPTIRQHPDGLSALQHLIGVVFEAHLPPKDSRPAETLVERACRGARHDV